jgi:predicted small lipoprotein YifL
MENSGRILTALLGLAVVATLAGAGLTGCSPLDDSQKFDPDTANASTVVGPFSL